MNRGNAFWTVNSVPRVQAERRIEVVLGDLAELALRARAGTCPQHVDSALVSFDRVEHAVQVVEVGRIALYASHVPPDQFNGPLQLVLPSA